MVPSEQNEPTDIIFIPGTSIQNVEILEEIEEQNDNITTNNETKTFMGLRQNTEEFRAKMDNLFLSTNETMDDSSEQIPIGELTMNDEGNRENERFLLKKNSQKSRS